jgi:hypothetical protein
MLPPSTGVPPDDAAGDDGAVDAAGGVDAVGAEAAGAVGTAVAALLQADSRIAATATSAPVRKRNIDLLSPPLSISGPTRSGDPVTVQER